MRIEPFAMERLQSSYEHQVEFNLSESGVHPLRVEELLDERKDLEAILELELGYSQTNGTPALREAVAALSGASAREVLVTNGGAESNLLAVWHLVEPGDEVVLMLPNYMQAPGLVRAFGGTVREWWLRETAANGAIRWRADLDALGALITPKTRLIAICNPNNPTGVRFDRETLAAICAIADRAGCWILSDEIYRGVELDGRETASCWGLSERVIVTSGLAKAYGLPGLRIGWTVAPAPLIEALWGHHDYTTIGPGAISDRLACLALTPPRRQGLLNRARGIVRANYATVHDWLARHAFAHAAPDAGAIVLARYPGTMNSTAFAEALRVDQSVLVVPGDHFGMDGWMRIGFGSHPEYLRAALGRVHDWLAAHPPHAA
jgi:aspartate/methionine/tyrosine aminotransferase